MGLTYHYSFAAPKSATTRQLTDFLRRVEKDAQMLGYGPTVVMSAAFDSPERLEFARRITTGKALDASFLEGRSHKDLEGVWHVDPRGSCRVAPEHGVFLVVTDERGTEVVLGFFRYPQHISDVDGRKIGPTNLTADWAFADHAKSADPRLRKIVAHFREAGFLASELDEFESAKKANA